MSVSHNFLKGGMLNFHLFTIKLLLFVLHIQGTPFLPWSVHKNLETFTLKTPACLTTLKAGIFYYFASLSLMLSSSEINQYYFENERFLWQNLYMSLLYDMQGVSILVFDCLCGTRLCTDIINQPFLFKFKSVQG